MLTSVDDLISTLSEMQSVAQTRLFEPLGTSTPTPISIGETDREHIFNLLSPTAIETDDIIRESSMTPDHVLAVLLELEIAGRVMRHAGGRVSAL